MSSTARGTPQPIDILLVEDDPGDVELTRHALKDGKVFNSLNVVEDGVEALKYLRKEGDYADSPRPDLILMDLNMPRMDGRETLEAIKSDESFRGIPVVILTTSDAQNDVARSYDLQASCYITKPVDLKQFTAVVKGIKEFWLCLVKFPSDLQ